MYRTEKLASTDELTVPPLPVWQTCNGSGPVCCVLSSSSWQQVPRLPADPAAAYTAVSPHHILLPGNPQSAGVLAARRNSWSRVVKKGGLQKSDQATVLLVKMSGLS